MISRVLASSSPGRPWNQEASLVNNVDFALALGLGSAIQITLGVFPALVLLGWLVGQPLSLDLRVFETLVLFLSALVAGTVVSRARSTYLEGVLLLGAYAIVAMSYLQFSHDEQQVDERRRDAQRERAEQQRADREPEQRAPWPRRRGLVDGLGSVSPHHCCSPNEGYHPGIESVTHQDPR